MAFVAMKDTDGVEHLFNVNRVMHAERVCGEQDGVWFTCLWLDEFDEEIHLDESLEELCRLFNDALKGIQVGPLDHFG